MVAQMVPNMQTSRKYPDRVKVVKISQEVDFTLTQGKLRVIHLCKVAFQGDLPTRMIVVVGPLPPSGECRVPSFNLCKPGLIPSKL